MGLMLNLALSDFLNPRDTFFKNCFVCVSVCVCVRLISPDKKCICYLAYVLLSSIIFMDLQQLISYLTPFILSKPNSKGKIHVLSVLTKDKIRAPSIHYSVETFALTWAITITWTFTNSWPIRVFQSFKTWKNCFAKTRWRISAKSSNQRGSKLRGKSKSWGKLSGLLIRLLGIVHSSSWNCSLVFLEFCLFCLN
jgi:hypothetical protein